MKEDLKICPEVLLVFQGFERGDKGDISDFCLDDFRGKKLPNYSEEYSEKFRKYYRIERLKAGSKCPWGYSRWTSGDDGKLYILDERWDTSG